MNFWESLNMAGKTLSANRLRSALTMLGIIIGNASVIAIVGVGEGTQKYAASQFQSLGTNVIFVIAGSDNARRNTIAPPNRLVWSDAEAIASQVPTVEAVAPQINASELVIAGNNTERVTLVGTTPSYQTVRNAETCLGRFFDQNALKRSSPVITLGAETAKKLFPEFYLYANADACKPQGGTPLGKQVRIKGASYEVLGIMNPKGAFLGTNQDDIIFMPISTMTSRLVGRTSPYGVGVQVINVSAKGDIRDADFQITNLLKLRHGNFVLQNGETFTIRTQKDALQIVGNVTGALTIMLAAIACISLLVGGIGIMNIMLVSVTERTQEIGLRKALGATERDILSQFIIEAVILSVIGGAVGASLGVGGIVVISALSPLEPGISLAAIAMSVTISGSIGLFFGVFPAQQAAKLDPIVALRTA